MKTSDISLAWRALARHTVLLSALAACGPTDVSESEPPRALKTTAQAQLTFPLQASAPTSVTGPQAGATSFEPAVAMGNGLYFLAWVEYNDSTPPKLYGRRVRASDGVALDAQPLVLAPGSGHFIERPSVAFDGENFFVVWSEGLPTVFGRRVRASDGALLDAAPRLYSEGPNSSIVGRYAAVSFDGTNYLLTWLGTHFPAPQEYYFKTLGRRVRPSDGNVLDAQPFVVGEASRSHVSSTGGTSLAVWGESGGIQAVRVDSAGQVLDASPIVLSAASSVNVRVASRGGEFLVLWSDNGLWARRVRASDGALLGAAVLLDSTLSTQWGLSFDATFDGEHYRVLWSGVREGTRRLLTARLSPNGSVDAGSEQRLAEAYPAESEGLGIAAAGPGRFMAAYNPPANVSYRLVQPFSCAPDVTPPIITCPATKTYQCVYSGQRVMTDFEYGDNCGIAYTGTSPNYIGQPGIQTNHVSVTDLSGNSASCATQWNIVDTEEPTVTLHGPTYLDVPYGTPYQEPGYSAEDGCDGYGPWITSQVQVYGTVNTYQPGFYERHYVLTDRSGNIGFAIRIVRVLEP